MHFWLYNLTCFCKYVYNFNEGKQEGWFVYNGANGALGKMITVIAKDKGKLLWIWIPEFSFYSKNTL